MLAQQTVETMAKALVHLKQNEFIRIAHLIQTALMRRTLIPIGRPMERHALVRERTFVRKALKQHLRKQIR